MSEPWPKPRGSLGRRWHRTLGIVSALFVVVLSLTGLMLNHSHGLGLDRRHADAAWLLEWYGTPSAGRPLSFRAGNRWVSWFGDALYLDGRRITEQPRPPVGAVRTGAVLAVGLPDAVVLLTPDGRVVDRLGAASGLPGRIERVGIDGDGRLLAAGARRIYAADPDLTRFRPEEGHADARWSRQALPPETLARALVERWRGRGPSLERLLLDLHSGRFWGPWGVWLMDGMALIFLVLSVTGAWLWWRRRRNGRVTP